MIENAISMIRQQCLSVNTNDMSSVEEFIERVDEQLSILCQLLAEKQKPIRLK